ncbi:hypothetical protein KVR01_011508 [Diaporthe batatas]|uniref:uncharacterized protein n=1 Tax=Diaporthe batatas TaxID=748121 RepID=UPI001D048E0D|nr:uncharacterized protein KVR01_011508 [Diaporthe batatas]KAG8158386.1 hypothetical protein KVR01_011508 [Diaporthe batatas]
MSPPPATPGQASFDSRDLETRIDDCLTDILSNDLIRFERRSGRIGSEDKSFFCRSDLESIWTSEPRPLDIVFGHLSERQRETLFTDLLLFVSFLVKVEVRPRFFLACRDVLFQDPESAVPKFKDDDGPRSQAELVDMGLSPRQANSWKEQYRFRPAKITFATEKWAPQRIDPRIPLPFELTDDVHSGVMIHGGFGDDSYNSQYGTVRLYRIPREYIENEIRASETWEPTAPLLRIVKSFSARQLVVEEAKNMELLKQSLVTNVNISIHDAIIEQRQEDDTGIVSIVSPYASLGDLAQFLAGGYDMAGGPSAHKIYDFAEKFPAAIKNSSQLRMSLLAQSKNLASALEFLHSGFKTNANDWKIKCAHLDLKPSNILIFESSQREEVVGTWKLSDFGISVFGAEHLRGSPTVQLGSAGDYFMKFADTIRTSPKRIPGVYQAPEIEHPQPSSDDSNSSEHGARTSDIWSFGAILAEVLAFAHDGALGVKRFDSRRRSRTTINGAICKNDFFYTNTPEHMRRSSTGLPCTVRREVSLWLEEFSSGRETEPAESGVCFKCWAECVKNILEVNPHARPSAPRLSQWITDLHRHSRDNTTDHMQFGQMGPRRPGPKPLEDEPENISTPPQTSTFLGPNPALKSHLFELKLSSGDVIDYDLDGSKLVYLTKKGLDIFLVSDPETCLEREPLQSDHMWRGIKVAEPYVVIWGSRLSHGRESVLRVYDTSNGPLSHNQPAIRTIYFNVTRRVAVSRQGFIAVIQNHEILVLDAKDSAVKELSKITMLWQEPVGKFVDISFDDSGSVLYAWGHQNIYGVLFAYKFEQGGHGVYEEIFRGKFKDAFSEHKAMVLPFDRQHECAVAVGPTPTRFFLGNIDQPRWSSSSTSRKYSSSTGSDRLTPQKYSHNLHGYNAWAACTINDSMLLVGATKSGFLSHRKVEVSEQIIGTEGILCFPSKSPVHPTLETKTPWAPRHNPDLNTEVKVGVIPSKGAADGHSIVVYYKKGVVEVLS